MLPVNTWTDQLPEASIALLSCQQTSNQPVANENKPAASPEGPKKMAAYDAEAISNRLVTQVAGVKENDVVFINGGLRDFELLEDLATDTRKAGAWPLLALATYRNILQRAEVEVSGDVIGTAKPFVDEEVLARR